MTADIFQGLLGGAAIAIFIWAIIQVARINRG
jgi:hypothetical protein